MKIKKLSVFADRMMPDFVHQDYQQFTKFVKYYFEYLEQNDGVYDYAANALEYMDIDETKPAFLEEFQAQYLINFPEQTEVSVEFLVKHIREFYLAKGSEKSYEFLFRLLYGDDDIDIYYPKLDILRCSDGKWNEANQNWDNTDGWLSSDKKLQDNYYYQDFSYEIMADVTRYYYENVVHDNIHPTGQLMFGKNTLINPSPLDVSKFDYDTYDYESQNVPDETAIWRGSPVVVESTEFNNHTIMIDVDGLYVEDSIEGAYLTIGANYEPDDIVGMRRLGHAIADNFAATGDGVTDSYNIGGPAHSGGTEDYNIFVLVDGLKLKDTDDYVHTGNNIDFVVPPANLSKIRIIRHPVEFVEKLSSTGTSKTLIIGQQPQGLSKDKVIVFANGKIITPLEYDAPTRSLTFANYVPEGTNNIEVCFIDALEYTEHLTVLELVVNVSIVEKYNIFTNFNQFKKLPEAFRTNLLEGQVDAILPKIDDVISLLNVFVYSDDVLATKITSVVDIFITLSRIDSIAPLLSDVALVAVVIEGLDSLLPKITDVATIVFLNIVADSLLPKIDETTSIAQTTEETDISFTSTDVIETVGGDFTVFNDGDTIVVTSTSTTNDGTYTIDATPTATTISIAETTLTTEDAATAGTVTITRTV